MFSIDATMPKHMKAMLRNSAHPFLFTMPYTSTNMKRPIPRVNDEPIDAIPANSVGRYSSIVRTAMTILYMPPAASSPIIRVMPNWARLTCIADVIFALNKKSITLAHQDILYTYDRVLVKEKRSLRTMIAVAAIAIAIWAAFNLYPQLQAPQPNAPQIYPQESLWTYSADILEGTNAVYNVYHISIGHNVTVSYTVTDVNRENGTWAVSIEVTDGEEKESAYAITKGSMLPVGGSQIVGDLEKFGAATKMPIAEFMAGLEDQPLVVGASWQMAFLAPDNTYTRSYIAEKREVKGQEVFVLKYGPENSPSFAWVAKNYPIPLHDEYTDPLSGEIISIHELVKYESF